MCYSRALDMTNHKEINLSALVSCQIITDQQVPLINSPQVYHGKYLNQEALPLV